MLGRGIPVAMMLLVLALAGCTAHSKTPPPSKPLASEDAIVKPATLLRVLVINDEFLPIVGAHVNVVGLGLNTTTDDVGNAYFQIGTPGRYALHVHHSHFYPNMTKIAVDGTPKLVSRVTLKDAPHDAHIADFYEYQGLCGPTLYVPDLTPSDCRDTPLFGRPAPHWFLAEGLTNAYFELDWNQSPTGPESMRLDLSFPDAGPFADGSEHLVAQGKDPVRLVLPSNMITPPMRENGHQIDLKIGIAPGAAPLALNAYQEFTLDAELDYYLPAPDVDPEM